MTLTTIKYRKVSTSIWNDDKFRDLSHDAKLAFLFVITHPYMTPLGAIRATLPGLAAELRMESEAFAQAFGEVFTKGMAKQDEGLLIWFPNFLKHNPPTSPNVVKSWVPAVRDLPECALKEELIAHAACTVDGLTRAFKEAFTQAFGIPCGQPSGNQGDGNREQEYGKGNTFPLSESQSDADGYADASPNFLPEVENASLPESQPSKDGVYGVAFDDIAALFNRLLVDEQPEGQRLPKVQKVTAVRKGLIKARMKTEEWLRSLEGWEEYFRRVARCPWLMGESNGGQWRADFQWLLNVNNFLKVVEGNFIADSEKKAARKLPQLSRVVDTVSRMVAKGQQFDSALKEYCTAANLSTDDYRQAVMEAMQ